MSRVEFETVPCRVPPEQVFASVAERAGSVFLDSAGGREELGRYSYIALDPFLVLRANEDRTSLWEAGGERACEGDPLETLRGLLARFGSSDAAGPVPFCGGALGGLAYEFGSRLEDVPRAAPVREEGPEMYWGFYDGVIAFERGRTEALCIANPVHRRTAGEILRGLRRVLAQAEVTAALSGPGPAAEACARADGAGLPASNFARGDYLAAVQAVRDRIATGEVYQVNLSQRFEAPFSGSAYDLYLRLRGLSPAPFACFLNLGELQLASSSPERFLRIEGRRVETRPIKGTRPRGSHPAEDEQLRRELWASEKDRAELLMIVDLERNDLGRVCETGSVAVEELYRLEDHPTVFHLVSTVSGRLRPGLDVIDCLRATFPGGSITGAPKISSQKAIAALERGRRGFYTGALGYIAFNGDCDLNIAIRTVVCRGDRAAYHVGGGIVWDSDPEREYEETLVKGKAMLGALRGAGGPGPGKGGAA